MRSIIERLGDIDLNKISADKLNKALKAISDDIIMAYTEMEKRKDEVENINRLLLQENRAIQNSLNNLVNTTQNLFSLSNKQRCHYTHYYDDVDIISDNIEVNKKYGILSPKMTYNSKIILSEYSKQFLLQNFDMELVIFDGNGNKIKNITLKDDASLINMFTGKTSDIFINSLELGNHTDLVTYELYITLPKNIMSNLHINNIEINPTPIFELDLTDISVKKDNKWETIKNFSPIKNMGNEFIVFKSEYCNQIKLTFNQKSNDKIDKSNVFTFGLRKLDIRLLTVENNMFEWTSHYNLNSGSFYGVVYTPELETNNECYVIETRLYTDKNLTHEINFNEELNDNINEIYVHYKVDSSVTQIPLIYSETVNFEIKL